MNIIKNPAKCMGGAKEKEPQGKEKKKLIFPNVSKLNPFSESRSCLGSSILLS